MEPGARPSRPWPLSPDLAAREQEPHQHPLREHQLLALRLEAQRRDLEGGALGLALEDARQERHELALREEPRGPRRAAARGAHGAVLAHLHLGLAERRGHEPPEARELERSHAAELDAATDDRVGERAADRQGGGLVVLREVEAGDEHAHRARSLVERVEAAGPQLERRLSRVARHDAQRRRLRIAVARAA